MPTDRNEFAQINQYSNQYGAQVGRRIRINDTCPVFPGEAGAIAYIGEDGISVYLFDDKFDDCVPIMWEEFTYV